MKFISKKFIGSVQACSAYLPFAVSKVKNVVEKERGNKTIASRSYSFSNGIFIKCTATNREYKILIQAALGGLIFIGRNDSDPTIRVFQSDGFTHNVFSSNPVPTSLSPYLAPFPNIPNGSATPKYDWRNNTATVYAGVGLRYSVPGYDKTSLDKYFVYTFVEDTAPTVCDKSGVVTAQGITGSEVTGAGIFENYCVGISIRGEIRAWKLSDPDIITTRQLELPSWVGVPLSLETSSGSGIYHVGYQGWLDGNAGVEWKINEDCTRAVGMMYEAINYGTAGTGQYTGSEHYWRAIPHAFIVKLNPYVNDDGDISFSPTLIDNGANVGIVAIDWYMLDDFNDTLMYSFIHYSENEAADTRTFRLQFIKDRITEIDDSVVLDSFNIRVESYTEPDIVFGGWKVKYEGWVTGLDLRYTVFSYWGTETYTGNDTDDISYAKGFNKPESEGGGQTVYKDQIGNVSVTDNYFDYRYTYDSPTSGTPEIGGFFNTRHRSVQYSPNAWGTCCAALDNGSKKFAYMTITPNNNGLYYDVIQRDAILTTHEDVFSSLGFTQDTDGDGRINAVYHILGVFT